MAKNLIFCGKCENILIGSHATRRERKKVVKRIITTLHYRTALNEVVEVDSDTRYPWFESSHCQFLFSLNCIEKRKKNEPGNGRKNLLRLELTCCNMYLDLHGSLMWGPISETRFGKKFTVILCIAVNGQCWTNNKATWSHWNLCHSFSPFTKVIAPSMVVVEMFLCLTIQLWVFLLRCCCYCWLAQR